MDPPQVSYPSSFFERTRLGQYFLALATSIKARLNVSVLKVLLNIYQ